MFFSESIEFLSRKISAQGIRPGQNKIEALIRMERSRSVKQMRLLKLRLL